MKRNKSNKGFTLAELLVVVGIIAVLVAISIPVFTSQLHKAKVATDWANLRALYAEIQTKHLTEEDDEWTYAKACTLSSDKKTISCGNGQNIVELQAGTIVAFTGDEYGGKYNYWIFYNCDNTSGEGNYDHVMIVTNEGIQTGY